MNDAAANINTRDEVEKLLLKDAIENALDTLTDREKAVIRCRFFEAMTFDKIGKLFNVGRERASQICRKALRKLRHPSRADILQQFWIPYPEMWDKILEERKREKEKIEEEQRRAEYMERKEKELNLMGWWEEQMTNIRAAIDFDLPPRPFSGTCECKIWNAEYSLPIDEYEALCCRCLTKFWMKANER